MSQKVYLGIDTSCYTTSAALLAEDGSLLAEARQILSVKPGRCGLQQSEMVFQHTRNLPRLVEDVFADKDCTLAAIGVSGYPRPLADSYMPAFLAGMSVARSLAAAYKVPLEVISHQENHLEAGLWSAGGPQAERFLLLHASGGTTDLLLCERREDSRYNLTQVGGSSICTPVSLLTASVLRWDYSFRQVRRWSSLQNRRKRRWSCRCPCASLM